MKRLIAGCPRCGLDQSVPTEAVFLTVSADTPDGWLVCLGCGDLVSIGLPAVAFDPLAAAGCHVLDGSAVPAAPPHPERWIEAPPLDADDVLAWHELLNDEHALTAALTAMVDTEEGTS